MPVTKRGSLDVNINIVTILFVTIISRMYTTNPGINSCYISSSFYKPVNEWVTVCCWLEFE